MKKQMKRSAKIGNPIKKQPRFHKKFTSKASAYIYSTPDNEKSELNALVNQAADSLFPQAPGESHQSWLARYGQIKLKSLCDGRFSTRINDQFRVILQWVDTDQQPDTTSTDIMYIPRKGANKAARKGKRHDLRKCGSRYLEVDIRSSDKQNKK